MSLFKNIFGVFMILPNYVCKAMIFRNLVYIKKLLMG